MIGLPRLIEFNSFGVTSPKEPTQWAHDLVDQKLTEHLVQIEAMHPGSQWVEGPTIVEVPIMQTDFVYVSWHGLLCPAPEEAIA